MDKLLYLWNEGKSIHPAPYIMISPRENLLKVLRRSGMEKVPVDFVLCESQIEDFEKRFGHRDYFSYFGLGHRSFEMNVQRNFSSGHELYPR